ncbi:MAG: DUF6338 family protein [Solirubrobacteraceae bacterium]
MIPGTLLGALFLAACLVPGFIFQRAAERRRPQFARSALVEAVELAGTGAASSLFAATVVLLLASTGAVFDANALADDPGRYVLLHPLRVLGPVLVIFGASCGLAWGAALVLFRNSPSAFDPAGTVWSRTLMEKLPSSTHLVVATVELKDRRRVIGVVSAFSSEADTDRELALVRPLAAQPAAGELVVATDDDFVLLRESQIVSIVGRYVDSATTSASEK